MKTAGLQRCRFLTDWFVDRIRKWRSNRDEIFLAVKILLVVFLVLGGLIALVDVLPGRDEIIDNIPAGSPKGYVEFDLVRQGDFFQRFASAQVWMVEEGRVAFTFPSRAKVRIARVPGDHEFKIHVGQRFGFTKTVTVHVEQQTITRVHVSLIPAREPYGRASGVTHYYSMPVEIEAPVPAR